MSSSDPSPILSLLARWEIEKSAGHAFTPEELCRDNPGLLDEVRKQLAKLQAFPDQDTVDITKPFNPSGNSALTEEKP